MKKEIQRTNSKKSAARKLIADHTEEAPSNGEFAIKTKTAKSRKSAKPTKTVHRANVVPSHGEIALCAYLIWEDSGRPHNQDFDIWLQAENLLVKNADRA